MPWGGCDEGCCLGAEIAQLRTLLVPEPQVQNQSVVDRSKETNRHSLKAENSVLFGRLAEGLRSSRQALRSL